MSFAGVYEKMKFPAYQYREYPKMLKLKNGKSLIVNNQHEELRAMEEVVPVTDVAKLEADKANVEKLLAEAQARLKELEEQMKEQTEPTKVKPAAPAAPAGASPKL